MKLVAVTTAPTPSNDVLSDEQLGAMLHVLDDFRLKLERESKVGGMFLWCAIEEIEDMLDKRQRTQRRA